MKLRERQLILLGGARKFSFREQGVGGGGGGGDGGGGVGFDTE